MTRYRINRIALLLAVAGLTGCATVDTYVPPVSIAHSGVLFDRYPGYPTAGEMIRQGDWPSTVSQYQATETIFYRETIHDFQGYGLHHRDHGVRRFELQREGSATR